MPPRAPIWSKMGTTFEQAFVNSLVDRGAFGSRDMNARVSPGRKSLDSSGAQWKSDIAANSVESDLLSR